MSSYVLLVNGYGTNTMLVASYFIDVGHFNIAKV
jgi:hypothetical protein